MRNFQVFWIALKRFFVDRAFSFLLNIYHIFSFRFRAGLFAGHIIDFIYLCRRKILISSALWQNVLSSWKMISSPNQISVEEMKILSKIQEIYVDCCWDNDWQHCLFINWYATPSHEWLGKFVFLLTISLYFIRTTRDNIFRAITLDNLNSLFVPFIQSSTRYDCFSLIYFSLVLYLCVCIGFRLAFLFVNPISFNQFLAVFSLALNPLLTNLVFFLYLFCYIFSIFMAYYF